MPPKHLKFAGGVKLTAGISKSHGNHKKKIPKKVVKKSTKKGNVKKKITTTIQRRRPGDVENFIVAWLDSHIDLSKIDYQNSIKQLRCIANSITTFTNVDQSIAFLCQIKDEKLFLIVSGSLGEFVVPVIEDLPQLHSIYVFCCDKLKHQTWACKHNKIRDIFTEIGSLCALLKNDIRQCDNNLMPISILSKTDYPTHDLNALDPSFMYSKLLKEILMQLEHNNQAKENLVKFCCSQYEGNSKELRIIDKFMNTYSPSQAILWYTRECFVYSMVNKALRTQDIEIIIKMGFFIRDLHQQIERLHARTGYKGVLTVYRGQGMLNTEFEKLSKCQGGLLSFNNFLSTSTDRQVSLSFARRTKKDPRITPILLQMEINPSISSTPFASVSDHGYYSNAEKEILFSMHTVFRIQGTRKSSENIWQVDLKLTDDNDEQLQKLTDHMRNETRGSTGWHRLGSLMISMGQFDHAEKFYTLAYEMSSESDWKEHAHIYYEFGRIHDEKDDPDGALAYYEQALDIQLEYLSEDDPCLSKTYTGIGSVLLAQCDFHGALDHFQYALRIAPRAQISDLLDIATIQSYQGGVLYEQEEYIKALTSYQEALETRQKHLPTFHPLLGAAYNNIGLVYAAMNDHLRALSFYKKTLDIEQKSLPSNHPLLAVTYHNMSDVLDRLCRYQEAVKCQTFAVDILQMTCEPNDPQVKREKDDLERLRAKL